MAESKLNLEEDLLCSICMEMFRKPVVLPCEHSFCRECIGLFAEKSKSEQTDDVSKSEGKENVCQVISCPMCRALTTLGRDGVDGLPANFQLEEIVNCKFTSGVRVEDKIPFCSVCENAEKVTVVRFCTTCCVLYCEDCLAAFHPMKGALKRHRVISSQEYLSEKTSEFEVKSDKDSNSQASCALHGLPFCLYCVPCGVVICLDCMEEHAEHGTRNIRSAAEKNKPTSVEKASELEKGLKQTNESLSGFLSLQNKIQDNKDLHTQDVQRAYSVALKDLNTWRLNALESIQTLYSKWSVECSAGVKHVQMQAEEMERMQNVSKVLLSSVDVEFLQGSVQLNKSIEDQLTENRASLEKHEGIRHKLLESVERNAVVPRKVTVISDDHPRVEATVSRQMVPQPVTSALKFPIDKWVKCVVDVIKDYAKRFMKDKALKEIHFVDKNPEFLRCLEEGLLEVFPQTWSQPNSQETISSKQSSASSESHQLTTFQISGPCQIVVQKTDITTFQGDAIVITVDKNISSPLSDAVSRAAGQAYTAEKDKKLRDKAGDVFVTDAGQLPCKYVVHALLSGSSTRKDDIGALVTCVLSEAEAVKIQTIAFPAISTGFVGMSVNAGCQLLVDNISSYMKNNPSTFLKKIYLVDIDEKKVDQFRVLLTQQISTLKKEQHELTLNHGYSTLQKSPDSPKLESKTKDDSSTLSTRKPVENRLPARFAISDSCTVEVEKADFRTFEGDALVVTVREDFTTAGGQDLALTMTAGEKYYEELKQKKSAKPGDVVVTGAGNMGYGHVIHGVWDTKHSSGVGELRTLVPRILNKADELEMKTLVVPPLWTGLLNITTHDGCSAVVEGIFRFVTMIPDISVKIYLLDTDMNTLDCYCKELRKRVPNLERVDPIQASGGGDVSMSGMSRADNRQSAVWSGALCVVCKNERVSARVRRCGHALCGICLIPGLDVQFCCKESSNPSAHTIPGIEAEKDEEDCVICLCPKTDPKSLQCGHKFCKDCIEEYFRKCAMLCPVCKAVCGKVTGNQPDGTMKVEETYKSCAGYKGYKSLIIHYNFPDGIQQEDHPHPGRRFRGARRTAYLPKTPEGRRILKLLEQAFEQRLLFTIGQSVTTGRDDVVTWNDVHHKTSLDGGPEKFGYPDPTYLSRVREELKAKGITESGGEGTPV